MDKHVESGSHRVMVLVFLAMAVCACYWLIQPFLQPIMLAILIGLLTYPLHERVVRLMHGRRNVASLVSCLALALLILIPTVVLLTAVLKQGIEYSVIARDWATQENIHHVLTLPWVEEIKARVTRILPEEALAANSVRDKALAAAGLMGRQFADVSTSILGSLTRFVINFILLLFVLFFVLRDHNELITFLHRAIPLPRSEEETLFAQVKAVSKSALLGSLLTALMQGVVGGFGLWLAGFPGVFWGAVMAFTSLVPFVGTALVWVPAALFLLVTGRWEWAVFMAVWGAVVVGSIDNFLRPVFMQGASMNTVVIFFSLLGGLQAFGLIGMIYGPLIVAIAFVLFNLYERSFADFLDRQDRT